MERTTRVLTIEPVASSQLDHIWEATGWCPPDSRSSARAMFDYAVQEASWQNYAFIAAVPNQGVLCYAVL